MNHATLPLHPAARCLRWLALATLFCAALGLGGCATLPDEGPRSYTTALVPKADAPATPLDRMAQASLAGAPAGQSGFRLLLDDQYTDGLEPLFDGLGAYPNVEVRRHARTVIVDRRKVFFGSVNFDPRSEIHNTEFGVLIESPELAVETLTILQRLQRDGAYQVRLKEGATRDLEWRHTDVRTGEELLDSEPGADLGTRMKLYIQSILIPESLL